MTHGYLLDANILSFRFDPARKAEHDKVVERVGALPADSPLAISAVTLGEIEYGHKAEAKAGYTPVQVQFNEFVRARCPMILSVTATTVADYGQLRAALFEKYGKKGGRRTRWPEQLIDPATSLSLGVQENDL